MLMNPSVTLLRLKDNRDSDISVEIVAELGQITEVP